VTDPSSFASLAELTDSLLARTRAITGEEPEDARKLRLGLLDDRAGAYGQYFGTWDIAAGMLRDFSMYTLYPLVRMARAPGGLSQPNMLDELLPPYTNYLGYSGFPELEAYGDALRRLVGQGGGAGGEALEPAVSAYFAYANRLYAWVYHYFPWNMGEHFRYPDAPPEAGAGSGAADLKPSDTLVRLTWEPLGVSVRAWLAVDGNPELCQDLLDVLPFTVLQDHPMVTGESIFAWTPMTSTAPIHLREEILSAPIGRLRYSQRTGQKLIVQYGETKETIMGPVLGSVLEEDMEKIPAVGRAVWDSTYQTKEPIWLTVERC